MEPKNIIVTRIEYRTTTKPSLKKLFPYIVVLSRTCIFMRFKTEITETGSVNKIITPKRKQ